METAINLLFIVLIVWFAYTRFGPTKGLRTLKDVDFRSKLETAPEAMLIDVREPAEFASGAIPGAINIPLSQLGQRIGEIPQERDLMLYCRSGMRSKTAARMLSRNGYRHINHLQGGISAWSGRVVR
ncbi:rhodanese-like domain-containing protein [Paenibacillus sp. OV219]|uniref:rhodanese-like domain-containing protein n=1 Tax=Paenibacillus sp. OV219 TaxID=1884377 RepID=UPI0008CC974F|nr:rhodanese-like domain-containing protein [Paenibacillus sp. OV219]SEN54079.1 Rhodanese-related sulfurtransferase [Paenibacillus sp. OV219]